jgi:Beta-propeller repeat
MSSQIAALITSFVLSAATAGAVTVAGSPRIPFAFVQNRGQASPSVRYIGMGPEFKAWFENRGVTLRHGKTTVRIVFEDGAVSAGARPQPVTAGTVRIDADNPIGARANYLHGSDPRQWQTDLPLFGAIHYNGVWPGVELTYRAEHGRLKAEYRIEPGTNIERILLRFDGAPQIQTDGTLRIHLTSGDFVEEKPSFYQSVGDERREVAGKFEKLPGGAIGFRVADYDHNQPLVIDPSILFSGYFGGTSEDNITAVGIDALNNVVTAGWTSSNNLPASTGAETKYSGSVDAFVASFFPNGGNLNYCTYVGGSGDDQATGLAIDGTRNVYITGWTQSTNFPLAGAFQNRLGGTRDAFVTKLNATGNALIYSTYLGGSGVDAGNAIALTPLTSAAAPNSVVIAGDTTSVNLPVTNSVFQPQAGGSQDAFVAMLSPAGNTLTFLTYLGGNGVDHASSVAIAQFGSIFIGGYTWSQNFPVVQAYQLKSGGGQDGFIAKLTPGGARLLFSTYLGGSGGSVGAPEQVNALCVDPLGNPFVAGTTSSGNFPVTQGALQSTLDGPTDGFVAHFSNAGLLLQSTFLGGALSDGISAMALDFHGNPYVTGFTSSLDFPVQNPFQNANAGSNDAFAAKLNNTLSGIIFGTYLGGSGSDGGNSLTVDSETSIVVAGQTSSGNYPTSGSLPNYSPTVLTSFITKIAPNFTLGVAYGYQGQLAFTADPWHVSSYVSSTVYGEATDLPIVGDWTGTGTKRIGIFRNGTWILDIDGNGVIDSSDRTVVFGQAGDIPIVGDWRGTGQIALGLFRKGTFILDLSGHLTGVPTGLSDATFTFGQAGNIPIVADWNGSGTAKVGVFLNGVWLVDYSGGRVISGLNRSYVYGQAGDIPVVGDWDSSGNPPKIGIYRAGLWVLDYDGDNVWTVPGLNEMVVGFGFAGYTPLVF